MLLARKHKFFLGCVGFLLCSLSLLWSSAAIAAALQPGFRTIGVWDENRGIRIDLAIWYPVSRAPVLLNYGEWSFMGNRSAKPLPGPYPLVLLSHDSSGGRFAHHPLATALARAGYVIVAPNHSGDNSNDMHRMFGALQIRGRVQEVQAALERIEAEPDLAEVIDTERIAFIGFGSGATTGLLLAGAMLEPISMIRYCSTAPQQDPYCSPWIRPRMESLLQDATVFRSFQDKRFRSVIAVSPAYTMLLAPNSIKKLEVPLLLLMAQKDRLNQNAASLEALRAALPPSALYGVLKGATLQDIMARSADAEADALQDDGALLSAAQRDTLGSELQARVIEFLARMGRAPQREVVPEPKESPQKTKGKNTAESGKNDDQNKEEPEPELHGPPIPAPVVKKGR